MSYWICSGTEVFGPLEMEEVLRRGDVSRETLVWTQGLQSWTPLGSLGGLDPVQELFVTCGTRDSEPAAVRYLEEFAEKLDRAALEKRLRQQAAAQAMLRREEALARAEKARLAEELAKVDAFRVETEEKLYTAQNGLIAAGDQAETLQRDREALEQALEERAQEIQREKDAAAEEISNRQGRIQELETEVREARRAESDAVAAIAVKAAEPPPQLIAGKRISERWLPFLWALWGSLVLLVGGYIVYRLAAVVREPVAVPAASVPAREQEPPAASVPRPDRRVVPLPASAPKKSVKKKPFRRAVPKRTRKTKTAKPRAKPKAGTRRKPMPRSGAIPLNMLPGVSGGPPAADGTALPGY